MDLIRKSGVALFVLIVCVLMGPSSASAASAWTSYALPGSTSLTPIASSADGTKLAVGAYNGYIYTSTDSGLTWTERTNAESRRWNIVTSSADGTKILAVAGDDPHLYISIDSGAHWTQNFLTGLIQPYSSWRSIVLSDDGTKLALITSSKDYIYTSTDSGVTWVAQTAAGLDWWYGITSSVDGTKLAAVNFNLNTNQGYILTSTDSGVTWTEQSSAGSHSWRSISSSADGTKLAAAVQNGYIYTSTDSGATWTERTSAGSRFWTSISSSADGTKLAAITFDGYIYTSTDSGANWAVQTAAGLHYWQSITSSADGTQFFAEDNDHRVWIGSSFPPPTISSISATSSMTSATLTWTTSVPSDSIVNYGTNAVYDTTVTDSNATNHSVTLSGLSCNTTYHYSIIAAESVFGGAVLTDDATFKTGYCPARTLYFNGVAGSDWNTLGSWWNDAAHTSPATLIPTEPDSVIIESDIWSNSSSDPVITSLTVVDSDLVNMTITVTATSTFTGNSSNASVITGPVVFSDSSYNQSTIIGNATFDNSSYNNGSITGDATFNSNASENYGTVSGTKTRRYTSDTVVTRNFIDTGPWTVLADGANVNIHYATFDTNPESSTYTALSTVNGGSFSTDAIPSRTFTVNSLLDDGDGTCTAEKCSLRDAVNNSLDGDTVTFSVTGVIYLTNGSFNTLDHSLTITGPGKDLLTIDEEGSKMFGYVTNGSLRISDLSITDGDSAVYIAEDSYNGGSGSVALTLSGVRFTNLDVNYPPIYIYGAKNGVTVTNSEFLNNSEWEDGGGIMFVNDANVTISNSTFANNYSEYSGGVIYHTGAGNLAITNSTFINNNDSYGYGSVANEGSGFATITNSTFYNSDPNGYNGIYLDTSNLVANNIFQSANKSEECYATSGGHNIDSHTSCGFNGEGDISSTQALLSFTPVLHNFEYTTEGSYSSGSLTELNSKFYGMTYYGGQANAGTIFEYDPTNVGHEYSTVHEFDNTTGGYPWLNSMIAVDGILYGMAGDGGGAYGYGVIFSFDPITKVYQDLHDFDYTDGAYPYGSLIAVNGVFYGLTEGGGSNYGGTFFSYDPSQVGNEYTILHNFDYSSDGANPNASLIVDNGIFYGLTLQGGANSSGTLFAYNPANVGSEYQVLHSFNNTDGANPYSSLIESNGIFYGLTTYGGTNNYGTIFQYDSSNVGNEYTVLHNFDGTNGGYPYGSLTVDNGIFYGLTYTGGTNGNGTLFAYNSAQVGSEYQVLHNFDYSSEGGYPQGSLISKNGIFYGLNTQGGINDSGTLFAFDPSVTYYYPTLADNGGPVQTIALQPGSPAIDAADDAKAPATDARGYARPYGAHADIGAYEYGASASGTPTPTPTPAPTICTSHCGGSASGSSRSSSFTDTSSAIAQTPLTTPAACKPGELFSTVTGRPCSSTQTSPTTQATPSSITSALATTATFIKNLKQGDRGGDVKLLQQYLNTHGFPISTRGPGSLGQETDFFGPATKAALIKYQTANGLPATGYFGPLTRALIGKGL